jgi:hypothetical protein
MDIRAWGLEVEDHDRRVGATDSDDAEISRSRFSTARAGDIAANGRVFRKQR